MRIDNLLNIEVGLELIRSALVVVVSPRLVLVVARRRVL